MLFLLAGFKDDEGAAAGAVVGFSAMAAFSCILARRILLLVDLKLLVEVDVLAAIFFRVDDAAAYVE
jgi:hypothetical protein